MRELSLHLLDLIENSLKAGAVAVSVSIEEDLKADALILAVEDDGPGLAVPPQEALDPFYTTKTGKKTGLGLSLFRFRVEQAGGRVELGRSELGGLAVRARMPLSHVDRSPLGDLASTLSAVVCTNPQLELSIRLCLDGREERISTSAARRELSPGEDGELAVARRMYRNIKEGLAALQIKE